MIILLSVDNFVELLDPRQRSMALALTNVNKWFKSPQTLKYRRKILTR